MINMKANEAPEKLYLDTTDNPDNVWLRAFRPPFNTCGVEYTRTDAFIEKAWDWIEDNLLSSNQQDKSHLYLEQFKNHMKGE